MCVCVCVLFFRVGFGVSRFGVWALGFSFFSFSSPEVWVGFRVAFSGLGGLGLHFPGFGI